MGPWWREAMLKYFSPFLQSFSPFLPMFLRFSHRAPWANHQGSLSSSILCGGSSGVFLYTVQHYIHYTNQGSSGVLSYIVHYAAHESLIGSSGVFLRICILLVCDRRLYSLANNPLHIEHLYFLVSSSRVLSG